MSKARVQFVAAVVSLVLLAAAAIGYVFAPDAMLSVVGIGGTPQTEFLVRTLAAALLAMLPSTWMVRKRTGQPIERAILGGLALYMFTGSAVDLVAYLGHLVGVAAIPSIACRVALGLVLFWLAVSRDKAAERA